jgi:hypothetical protein
MKAMEQEFFVPAQSLIGVRLLNKNMSTQQLTWMEMEDGGRWKIATTQWRWEVTLGGGLRLQRWCWAVAVAEEHATMALASALSKQRAYITTLASASGRRVREDMCNARDVHWQRWQQDRCITAAVAVAAVQIR